MKEKVRTCFEVMVIAVCQWKLLCPFLSAKEKKRRDILLWFSAQMLFFKTLPRRAFSFLHLRKPIFQKRWLGSQESLADSSLSEDANDTLPL